MSPAARAPQPPPPSLRFTFEIANVEGLHVDITAANELDARAALAAKLDRCGYSPTTSVKLIGVERMSQVRSTGRSR